MKSEYQFETCFLQAKAAGMASAKDVIVLPMHIRSGDTMHTIDGGPCGFAWVILKGNTAFGRWLKKTGRASKAYGGGLQVWIHEHGQSMARKEAHARAMAKVFQDSGIEAHAYSRMD
jgi:hypothetical protein